jgi:hypothetical protein
VSKAALKPPLKPATAANSVAPLRPMHTCHPAAPTHAALKQALKHAKRLRLPRPVLSAHHADVGGVMAAHVVPDTAEKDRSGSRWQRPATDVARRRLEFSDLGAGEVSPPAAPSCGWLATGLGCHSVGRERNGV